MKFTKTILMIAAAGFLTACEEGMSTSGGGASGGSDMSLVRDAGLAGKIESARMNGATIIYTYYTDVVQAGRVIQGADAYCGGAGRSSRPVITNETVGGRVLETYAFTCA